MTTDMMLLLLLVVLFAAGYLLVALFPWKNRRNRQALYRRGILGNLTGKDPLSAYERDPHAWRPTVKQLLLSLMFPALASGVGWIFYYFHFTKANIITVYILSVLLSALFSRNYTCGAITSLAGVLLFNFFFTEPNLTLRFSDPGDFATFAVMLTASLITSTLALKSRQNAREKEAAALLARNEQDKANLLRAISHDLRTPLTSISGNAENLLKNSAVLSEETKRQMVEGIYEDAVWLAGLVENLLSVTRMGEGAQLHFSPHLMDEVITESLRHTGRKAEQYTIETVFPEDELLLAQMDARLMSQVVINLVDNALKYTPPGSTITVKAGRREDIITVSVSDTGPGIPADQKERVFDMFFTGEHPVADCHRSLGLGLALCKTIVTAHGGQIYITDNIPHGAVFTFTIPVSEVTLHE